MTFGTLAFFFLVMAATLVTAWRFDHDNEPHVLLFVGRDGRARIRCVALGMIAVAIAGLIAWSNSG